MALDECLDTARLDTPDFHTAGWMAAHWGGRPYGVPSQTTPELLFYRKDLFATAGLEPPDTTDNLIDADTLGPHAFHPSPTSSAIFEAGCTSRLPVAHVMAELITDVSLWATWAGRMPWC
jgi:hypothetical protein